MTIKIIHLVTSHQPYDTRVLKRECLALSEEENYEVMLLNAFGIEDSFNGVKIKHFDHKRGRIGRYSISIMKALHAIYQEKPTIVHIHDPELFIFVSVFKKMGILVVVDIHEKFEDKIGLRDWIPKYLSIPIKTLLRITLKHVDKKADGIIAATPHLLKDFKNPNSRSIRNYPDLQYIADTTAPESRDENLVIYTGGLTKNRGIELVIRALHTSTLPWKLEIYGKVSKSIKKELNHLLNDPRIEIKGQQPFENVVKGMKKGVVGVVCNEKGLGYENALPNKMFEYMAAGLAIVATDFDTWKDLVENNNIGKTCNPHDKKELSKTILSFLWNKEVSNTAGNNGRNLAQSSFSWAVEKHKLLDLYNSILGKQC